jgi:hypothetical protein
MKFAITNEDLGGNAIGCNSQPIYCVDCSPEPLDYMTAIFFRVGKMGVKNQTDHKPNLDIAMCPVCGKQIAY